MRSGEYIFNDMNDHLVSSIMSFSKSSVWLVSVRPDRCMEEGTFDPLCMFGLDQGASQLDLVPSPWNMPQLRCVMRVSGNNRKPSPDMSGSIAPFTDLLSHFRFLLTLRSSENQYHSLILFRLSTSSEVEVDGDEKERTSQEFTPGCPQKDPAHSQLYIMESACPHLGADMSHADIEECETGVVAVCPWHRSVSLPNVL